MPVRDDTSFFLRPMKLEEILLSGLKLTLKLRHQKSQIATLLRNLQFIFDLNLRNHHKIDLKKLLNWYLTKRLVSIFFAFWIIICGLFWLLNSSFLFYCQALCWGSDASPRQAFEYRCQEREGLQDICKHLYGKHCSKHDPTTAWTQEQFNLKPRMILSSFIIWGKPFTHL